MCKLCWEDAGSPDHREPEVIMAALAVSEAYSHSGLHILIEDWNVEDHNLDFCQQNMKDRKRDGPAEQKVIDLFRKLTVPQRYAALAIDEGIIKL